MKKIILFLSMLATPHVSICSWKNLFRQIVKDSTRVLGIASISQTASWTYKIREEGKKGEQHYLGYPFVNGVIERYRYRPADKKVDAYLREMIRKYDLPESKKSPLYKVDLIKNYLRAANAVSWNEQEENETAFCYRQQDNYQLIMSSIFEKGLKKCLVNENDAVTIQLGSTQDVVMPCFEFFNMTEAVFAGHEIGHLSDYRLDTHREKEKKADIHMTRTKRMTQGAFLSFTIHTYRMSNTLIKKKNIKKAAADHGIPLKEFVEKFPVKCFLLSEYPQKHFVDITLSEDELYEKYFYLLEMHHPLLHERLQALKDIHKQKFGTEYFPQKRGTIVHKDENENVINTEDLIA